MKKRRPIVIVSLILMAASVSLLLTAPVSIRTVDFLKILVLGVCVGVLITQVFGNKS